GSVARKLGETLQITGAATTAGTYSGANLKTEVVGNEVQVKMADAPVFASLTTTGAATIGGPLTVTGLTTLNGGLNMAGNVITNVGAGAVNSTSTDAVNGSQLFDVSDTLTTNINNVAAAGVQYGKNPDGTVNYSTVPLAGPVSTDGGVTGGTTISNLHQGAVNATSTDAVNGAQLYQVAGDTSTAYTTLNGVGVRYVRTNETGLAPADAFANGMGSTAVGYNATSTAVNSLALGNGAAASEEGAVALGAGSKTAVAVATTSATVGSTTYSGFAGTAPTSTVSIGDVGAERTLTNVAAGRITATSTDAVNGSQLYSVADTLSTNINNVAAAGVQYGKNPDGSINYNSVPLSGPVSTDGGVTGGTTISSVHQGALNATSTDAVNGAQLYATNQNVAANTTSITNLANNPLTFTGNTGTVERKLGETLQITGAATTAGTYSGANLKTEVVGNEVQIKMADAPVFSSLTTTGAAIIGGAMTVAGPTTLNGGLTLGAGQTVNMGGNVLTNVGKGVAGTDGVNVDQLNAVSGVASKGWNMTTAQTGTGIVIGTGVTNIAPGATATFTAGNNIAITQVGSDVQIATSMAPTFTTVNTTNLTATGPTVLSGGTTINKSLTVGAGTTVNMGGNVITNVGTGVNPTDAVNVQQLQVVQSGGVQYVTNPDGSTDHSNVTLGGGLALGGTTVSNLAPGVNGTDAVNVNQMNNGLNTIGKAVNDMAQRMDSNAKDADAGTAGAMAMASMPQAYIPGKSMMAAGAATYQGQTSIAVGVSTLSENGKWVIKINGAANSRGKVGVAVGAGFHW
ncbi:MAG: hypothetical protein JWQ88_2882, partial [Rhodoferax sp.]|nr:hypothetical protein [Rhodoferax sp.]